MLVLLSLAKLFAFVIVSAESAARIGASFLPFFGKRSYGALERFGLGLLLGWMSLGTAFLGLALTSLFHPAVLLGCPFVLLALTRPVNTRKWLLREAARESGSLGATGLSVLGLACLPALARMLTYQNESTSFVYHLGAPWNYLLAGRALLENVPLAFHLPMPVDLTFALSLVIGDDRASKWQVATFLAAAAAVYAGGSLRRGSRDSAWLGMLLVLTTGHVMAMLGTSKNDLAATALFVTGAIVTRRGSWMLGSVLLGSCMAAKLTCAPAVALWLAFLPPPSGWRLAVVAGLAFPIAPWLVKTALATGNPIFPLATSFFPALNWDSMNERVAEGFYHNAFRGSYGLKGLPGMWLGEMRAEFMPVLLVLPGLLIFGSRREASACLLALLATFWIRHDSRYLLPVATMTCLIAAVEIGRVRDRFRTALACLLAGYCLALIPIGAVKAGFRRGDLLVGGDALSNRSLPYQESALRWLKNNGCRRAISVGEMRTYLFPCRLLHGGTEGETPLVWKMAKEARTPEEIGKRFKQLGVDCIIYNYISVEWSAMSYRDFSWSLPMARRYVDYCKRYEELAFQTGTSDFRHGGYFIYRIRREPVRIIPDVIMTAPGMDNLYGWGITARNAGRNQEAVAILAKAYRSAPDVGNSATQLGLAFEALGDYRTAFEVVDPWIGRRMEDGYNLLVYGRSAMYLGKFDTAEKTLRKCLARYPDRRSLLYTGLAMVRVARAEIQANAGRPKAAADLVREGEEFIARTPIFGDHEKVRRAAIAKLKALRANLAAQRGDLRSAAGFYREALTINPADANAPRWKATADQMDSSER